MEHTPGPWHVSDRYHVLGGVEIRTADDERFIARIIGPRDANDEANACLIAVAPELLEQLQHITDEYVQAMKDAGVTRYPEALVIVRKARAAIEKARGE